VLDAGVRYAEQLTDADLAVLAPMAGVPLEQAPALRAHPDLLESALSAPQTFERVFGESDELVVRVSPYLVFAVALHRALSELEHTFFVEERITTRMRVPVFDVAMLRDFAADDDRRIFVVELLASYTRVASGPIWVRRANGRGWRRQRVSELDAARLAAAIDLVPPEDRPGVYRRLGDLALFLTGVFPDHTMRRPVPPVSRERLTRSVRSLGAPALAEMGQLTGTESDLLAWLGPRWYRLAARATPLPSVTNLLEDVASRFDVARRLLNVVTDRVLFPVRGRLFPAGD
jgi:hypothetical protein